VAGRAPPPSKAVAGLLSQEGLGPGGNRGQAEAALREGDVELLMGKALEAATPQEVAHRTAEAGGCSGREGENLGKIPGLGHRKGLQGHRPLAQRREAAGGQFTKDLLNATDDKVPRGGDGVGKLGAH
jgi:hypothetical protein